MTMENTPITVGFAVVAAFQLALGIWGLTLTAKGTGKAQLRTRKNHVSPRASACSSIAPTDTP